VTGAYDGPPSEVDNAGKSVLASSHCSLTGRHLRPFSAMELLKRPAPADPVLPGGAANSLPERSRPSAPRA